MQLNNPQKAMLLGIEKRKAEELASVEFVQMETQKEREKEERRRQMEEQGSVTIL